MNQIQEYTRVSTLSEAKKVLTGYYIGNQKARFTQGQVSSATLLFIEQFELYPKLQEEVKEALWGLKIDLECNCREAFLERFSRISEISRDLLPPKVFQDAAVSNPVLKPLPKPKQKKHANEDDGFVLVTSDSEALKERAELFMRSVAARFLQDYSSRIIEDPDLRFLYQQETLRSFEPLIASIVDKAGFPKPSPLTDEIKSAVLLLLKGVGRFLKDFAEARPMEEGSFMKRFREVREKQGLPELYSDRMTMVQNKACTQKLLLNLLLTLAPEAFAKPEQQLLISTLSYTLAAKLHALLDQGYLFVLIDHISEIDLNAIESEPSLPLDLFDASDHHFSGQAGCTIYWICLSLIQSLTFSAAEKTFVNKGQKWLFDNQNAMGTALQRALNQVLQTESRLGIFKALYFALWKIEKKGVRQVFPSEKADALRSAPEKLNEKFCSFIYALLHERIVKSASEKNFLLGWLASAGLAFTSKTVKENLHKVGTLLFKILSDNRLLLLLFAYCIEEMQLSKK